MKLKIISDGTPYGTEVQDESGNVIENVTEIVWRIGTQGQASATMTIEHIAIEASVSDFEVVEQKTTYKEVSTRFK